MRLLLVSRREQLVERILAAIDGRKVTHCGVATDASHVLAMSKHERIDLVAIDVETEAAATVSLVADIMMEAPMPVVVIVDDSKGVSEARALDALGAGAVAIIAAPSQDAARQDMQRFLATLVAMAQVKVVRRWRRKWDAASPRSVPEHASAPVVGIVASTGGPSALKTLLGGLPNAFRTPILVVQHLADGFVDGMANALDRTLPMRVKVASDGEMLRPQTVYFAPDNRQLGLLSSTRVAVRDDPPVTGFRPSGTYLFRSLASTVGSRSLAVVLTGMGRDGTDGLIDIGKAGGKVIAQDEQTSAVFGMPRSAIASGYVDQILPLHQIAEAISAFASRPPKR